ECPVCVQIEVVREILGGAIIRVWLSAGYEDREEIRAIADISSGRTAVQPDKLFTVVDVAVDSGIAVLAVARAVGGHVDRREGRAGDSPGRRGGERQRYEHAKPATPENTAFFVHL